MARVRVALVVGIALVFAGCGSGATVGTPSTTPLTAAPATAQPASASPTEDANVVAKTYTLANGHSVYMACAGTGSPTVVFEAGDHDGGASFDRVRAALGQVTRTCAYDRPGTGQSGPASGCRDLDDLTAELAELLELAGETGPYVLVAASGGGFIAAGYAAENREDIAGMVFLDVPGHEFDPPPDVMEMLACDHPSNRERRDFVGVEREAWEARAEIGDIPVTIISADYGPDAPAEDQMNAEIQMGWLVLSPKATQVLVTTGHDVATEATGLVIDEIEKVVLAARAP